MKKSSFVLGATILSISGVLCKILGAVYKVPLANMLKTEGMGIYYLVFPIYSLFLTLSSSFFPSSISKMVADSVSENRINKAHKIFFSSLILLLILGSVFGVFLSVFANKISSFQGIENGAICYLCISPAILFVAIISAFRGYFQGLQNMVPTATSQILEQIIRFVSGFLLTILLLKFGLIYGVLGALLGVAISEFSSLVFLFFYFLKTNKKFLQSKREDEVVLETHFQIIKQILKTSIPFFLNGLLFPLFSVVDGFLIIKIFEKAGYEFSLASSLLGINTGIVNTITNLPIVVSLSIAMAIIPSVSFSYAEKDIASIENKISFAIKIVFLISIPCIFMFVFFGAEIVSVLFGGGFVFSGELDVAINLLAISSITILYQSILQIFIALMQAIGKAYLPVIIVFVSLIIKTILQVLFLTSTSLNILSVGISSFVCFFLAVVLLLYFVKKEFVLKLSFKKLILLPTLFTILMGGIIKVLLVLFNGFIPTKVLIMLSFFIGGVFYISMIFVFKIFKRQEFFTRKNKEYL